MARSSKVDACLICDEVPCSCFSKKAPVRKSRKAPTEVHGSVPQPGGETETSVLVSSSRPSMRDAMKAAAAAGRTVSARSGLISQAPKQQRELPQPPPAPDPNLVLASALRALAPILHESELARFSTVLGTSPSSAERAAAWRARVQNSD